MTYYFFNRNLNKTKHKKWNYKKKYNNKTGYLILFSRKKEVLLNKREVSYKKRIDERITKKALELSKEVIIIMKKS